MALDPHNTAAFGLHRFGLGSRSNSIAAIGSDVRGAFLAELDRPGISLIRAGNLMTSSAAAIANQHFQQEKKAARLAAAEARRKSGNSSAAASQASVPGENEMGKQAAPQAVTAKAERPRAVSNELYQAESAARIEAALTADLGFVERLTWFWSNHFCVAAQAANVRSIAGAYEREAIRPHVLGRFADMLLAVESHPAMLLFLTNVRSIGPDSPVGLNRGRGLNENLAREILELHTLGVRTMYTQTDVTNFAKVLTGWSELSPGRDPVNGGKFVFEARRHEPGPQTVLGTVYPQEGIEQGRAVLMDLARRPETARHIATKLAAHFVNDSPPPALVDRLAKRFVATDGDLKAVAKALLESEEAWDTPRAKLKRPGEWIISAMRAVDASDESSVRTAVQAHNMLAEPIWRPPSPKGFPDENGHWLDGVAERLDIANGFSRRVQSLVNPRDVLNQSLGQLASADTHQAVARAEDRVQGLTLVFMAPEFNMR